MNMFSHDTTTRNLRSGGCSILFGGLLLLVLTTPAAGMNDPVVGRWLTRDPLSYYRALAKVSHSDPNSRVLRSTLSLMGFHQPNNSRLHKERSPLDPAHTNQQLLLEGNPMMHQDPSGLLGENCDAWVALGGPIWMEWPPDQFPWEGNAGDDCEICYKPAKVYSRFCHCFIGTCWNEDWPVVGGNECCLPGTISPLGVCSSSLDTSICGLAMNPSLDIPPPSDFPDCCCIPPLKYTPTYGCFIEGTAVLTIDGEVNIEQLKVGDLVMTMALPSRELVTRPITRIIDATTKSICHVSVDGKTLSCSPTHPFMTEEIEWMSAIDLRTGDRLLSADGRRIEVSSVSMEILAQPVRVLDLKIEECPHYFVGDNHLLVHNKQ